MANPSENFSEQTKKIVAGLEEAYCKLIEFKKSKNSPLVVSENGEIKWISPFEVEEDNAKSQ